MASMTAEELRAEIVATNIQVQAEKDRATQLLAESKQADERQRLRRELGARRADLASQREDNHLEAEYRRVVDADRAGDHLPGSVSQASMAAKACVSSARGEECMCFGHSVAKGEYLWKLQQMSWLHTALRQRGHTQVYSDDFQVGIYIFDFVYNLWGSDLGNATQNGSLAIRVRAKDAVAIRHSIYVKKRGGDFVQWGTTCDEIHDPLLDTISGEKFYGPDVHLTDGLEPAQVGVFGLAHKQLLQSEWVEDDALTVKFVLEVLTDDGEDFARAVEAKPVEVPQGTIVRDMQALLEKGTCSDVEFRVQGEVIHAHSAILCTRSEVFEKQLSSGMQESMSKVVTIEDSDVTTFKAFLRYLYTDSLPTVEELAVEPPGAPAKDGVSRQLSRVQDLWAMSHKYQVTRLQRWCEAQLCQQLNASDVCSVLCQAHIFEAKQLEKACLSFITEHTAEVLRLPAYSDLITKWPEIAIKVHLFSAGLPDTEAAAIVQASKVRRLENGKETTS
ncbi:BPM6 [Symbiodinium natans]|uniref:BPM6 protein n=1 Tax=Symbiodinium natans TaxID=878477 RepID=A0A812S2K1_9DINO|nr:BPM6 [Symbiodinium natans]